MGYGKYGLMMRYERNPALLIGLDLNRKLVRDVHRMGFYDGLILADAAFLPFRREVFDTVVCIHAIEHMTKDRGMKLLRDLDRMNAKKTIVITPNGFRRWETHPVIPAQPYDPHLSGWVPDEFIRFDYKVHGIGADDRFIPQIPKLYVLLRWFFSAISWFIPSVAHELFCEKEGHHL